ncbi:MAG: site-specific integrase [Bacteroidetes bacterium]|nr:site-specific integrase [Bacteroidota bacterium]
MATSKVMLWKYKVNKEGLYPIVLRIIKDRKPKYIYLGPYVTENDWDNVNYEVKKSHPNSKRINNLILKKKAEASDILLEADSNNRVISSTQVKKIIKKGNKSISFFQVFQERYNDYIKLEKFSVAFSDESNIRNFKEFLNNEDISLSEITESLLNKFVIFLSTKENKKKQPYSSRTITNHLILIRTIYNKAITDGLIDRKNYPFGKGKIKIKLPESNKIGLEAQEVKGINDLKLEVGTSIFHAKNKWLFSFYFAGMRISDVLMATWNNFINGRYYYTMGKNKKVVSVKIPDQIIEILAYYEKDKRHDEDFIFPDMKTANLEDKRDVYRKLNTATKNTNEQLEKIGNMIKTKKKITNHNARHSFGNIAGDKISPQMLQKLYRHTDIRTTMGYQSNFIHKSADEALDTVVSQVV